MMKTTLIPTTTAALALLGTTSTFADSPGEPGRDAGGKNPLKNVYFGEQHLHTTNSPDAFVIGTRGTWDDAYKRAMGEEILLSTTSAIFESSGRIVNRWLAIVKTSNADVLRRWARAKFPEPEPLLPPHPFSAELPCDCV